VHTEIGREANLTDGTCPEQCHISIKCGFWISLCIYIIVHILGKLIVFIAYVQVNNDGKLKSAI